VNSLLANAMYRVQSSDDVSMASLQPAVKEQALFAREF
jgi:hypothetical protein